MRLSLKEAATKLGKSTRQVRYMVQKGQLEASKAEGRWFIELDRLPLSTKQQASKERKRAKLKETVEAVLGVDQSEPRQRRYSVRDLKAFQIAVPIYGEIEKQLGKDHPATSSLRDVLLQLSRGCHRFEQSEKALAYREARDSASKAVCELLLSAHQDCPLQAIAEEIEQELMPAFAGLLRRVDRKRRSFRT